MIASASGAAQVGKFAGIDDSRPKPPETAAPSPRSPRPWQSSRPARRHRTCHYLLHIRNNSAPIRIGWNLLGLPASRSMEA